VLRNRQAHLFVFKYELKIFVTGGGFVYFWDWGEWNELEGADQRHRPGATRRVHALFLTPE